MRRMVLWTAGAVVATMAGTSAASAACTVQITSGTAESQDTGIRMVVTMGETCGSRVSVTYYSTSEQRRRVPSRLILTSKPRGGTVKFAGSRFDYTPNKGFTGSDSFSFNAQPSPVSVAKNKPMVQRPPYRYQVQVKVY